MSITLSKRLVLTRPILNFPFSFHHCFFSFVENALTPSPRILRATAVPRLFKASPSLGPVSSLRAGSAFLFAGSTKGFAFDKVEAAPLI